MHSPVAPYRGICRKLHDRAATLPLAHYFSDQLPALDPLGQPHLLPVRPYVHALVAALGGSFRPLWPKFFCKLVTAVTSQIAKPRSHRFALANPHPKSTVPIASPSHPTTIQHAIGTTWVGRPQVPAPHLAGPSRSKRRVRPDNCSASNASAIHIGGHRHSGYVGPSIALRGVVASVADQVMHALLTHVGECHGWAGRVLGGHPSLRTDSGHIAYPA